MVFALVALSLVAAQPALGGTGMFVGAADDGARSLDPLTAKAKMDRAAIAGFGVLRMTVIWSPGEQTVGGDDLVALRNASASAQLDGVRLILSIYSRDSRTTPLSSRARGEFAQFAASIARRFPAVRDFVVGNEPNLNRFWMPQFGPGGADLAARSYELLLAATYDALKSVSSDVNVIGGALSPSGQDKANSARQTHSPTVFIKDLGAAYRSTGRPRPIMDMFAIHPYVIPSRLPPSFAHPRTTTIGIVDYPKLVRLLTFAFAGTAQRGETLPIVYDEFGYQSLIPVRKRSVYQHLGAPAARDAISEALQATYYRQAFALAACQPTVAGLLIFHVADERDARGWQSGVYYADGTPKSSLAAVRDGALAAQGGTLGTCSMGKTTSNLGSVVFHEPTVTEPRMLGIDFSCALPCSYEAQIVDTRTGAVVTSIAGKAVGAQTVGLPADGLQAGRYQYVLRALKCGKPGTGEARFSRGFEVPLGTQIGTQTLPLPLLPLLPEARFPLPTLLPTVPAAA
ncbi:MAG: hypothetical protein JWO17_1109 [Actinomycetia bacterium]|nr:hypothetical protein [Actinomycetes bacterium]